MTDRKKDSLSTGDFITIGVFSLIYFVVAFAIGGIAQATPVTFPFMPMIVALFAGSIFMLYAAKIPKRGAIFVLGILAGILLFVTGMFWMMSAFFIVFGFIADLICQSGNFKSFRRNLLAYCVFALSGRGLHERAHRPDDRLPGARQHHPRGQPRPGVRHRRDPRPQRVHRPARHAVRLVGDRRVRDSVQHTRYDSVPSSA